MRRLGQHYANGPGYGQLQTQDLPDEFNECGFTKALRSARHSRLNGNAFHVDESRENIVKL